MTLKSVVDIDLNDEKFKRFTSLYEKYQDALKKQPGQWRNAEQAVDSTNDAVNKILAAFLATGQFHREMAEDTEKDNKNLKRKASLWEKIQKSSSGVLKDVEGVSKWMLKWGGIGFGLSLGGLFGLRGIAEDVASQRNQALGLDLGIGQEKAFGLHQGRYFNNPDALLTGAFTARSNLASPAFQAIASLGINPNQSTVAIANQLLTKLQGMAKALPLQQVGNLLQEYPGLSQFGIGLQDLERLRNLSPAELKGQISAYGKDAKAFSLSDNQGQAFQNFVTSLDSTFGRVIKQIERDLVPLLGPIERLMSSIGKDISLFLQSKAAADGINAFAKAIDQFTKYLTSKEFQDGFKKFEDVVGKVGAVAHGVGTAVTGTATAFDVVGTGLGIAAYRATHHGDFPDDDAGFQRTIRHHMNGHGGLAPAPEFTAMPRLTPQNLIHPQVLVKVHLTNATGANVNSSVNALSGGVGF